MMLNLTHVFAGHAFFSYLTVNEPRIPRGCIRLETGGEGTAVSITGGTVIAKSGEGKCSAIGDGDNDKDFSSIAFSTSII